MSKSYVAVPPQSTGKKIATELRTEIKFDNEQNGGFTVGDTITGVSSNTTGVIAANEGELYLKNIGPTCRSCV